MAGNSRRQGAIRKAFKGRAASGSGGVRRQGLEGKGPTPPAERRPGHPAARKVAAARRATGSGSAAQPRRQGGSVGAGSSGGPGGGGPGGFRGGRPQRDSAETVAGRNAVVEALRVAVPATALYVATRIDSDDRVREAFKLAADLGVPLLEAPRPELDRLTSGAVHQGLALQLPPYEYAHPDDLVDLDSELPLLVALDGVTDPRNLGAVIRSTAAFGGHGVLVPERRSAGVTAATWKASAGAAAHVPVARATNLTRTLEDYKKAGLFVVGLDGDGDAQIDELTLASEPLVLVVGSEGKGLSRLVQQACDAVARIPMVGGTESLNAGVAAGIALYEVARQRRHLTSPTPRA